MNIFLNDSRCSAHLVPFSHTRHCAHFRIGIFTIAEKWQVLTGATLFYDATQLPDDIIEIAANVIPTLGNVDFLLQAAQNGTPVLENDDVKIIHYPWHIFQHNDWALRHDFKIVTRNRISEPMPASSLCSDVSQLFIEPGATISHAIFNTISGPVYIGKNAVVMEGACIRGPFALGSDSVVKMGTTIYGATSTGPRCTLGGEIKNSVFFGNSNKGHHGYLGDSVVGEWCNFGAGTTNSNVKNTGGEVSYYLVPNEAPVAAGNKAGLLMGDYTRTAINTAFNTGTVAGVCCNIFTNVAGSKLIANFSWGAEKYLLHKAFADIENWMQMKGCTLSAQQKNILETLYTKTLTT